MVKFYLEEILIHKNSTLDPQSSRIHPRLVWWCPRRYSVPSFQFIPILISTKSSRKCHCVTSHWLFTLSVATAGTYKPFKMGHLLAHLLWTNASLRWLILIFHLEVWARVGMADIMEYPGSRVSATWRALQDAGLQIRIQWAANSHPILRAIRPQWENYWSTQESLSHKLAKCYQQYSS